MKTYAVIGDPVHRSFSPAIHNAAFKSLGMDCTYIAYRIAADELDAGVCSLKEAKIAGFNVTIPHKEAIMDHLSERRGDCDMIKAANTIVNEGGSLVGYNTDVDGFMEPIKRRNIDVKGQEVLVAGAGGAARAIVAAFKKAEAGCINIVNRSKDRANWLALLASSLNMKCKIVSIKDAARMMSDCRFIVNATPAGSAGEPGIINTDALRPDHVVYDIVSRPVKTDLITRAIKAGSDVIYGYEMLIGQAALSFEIWHGVPAPRDIMKKAILGVVPR